MHVKITFPLFTSIKPQVQAASLFIHLDLDMSHSGTAVAHQFSRTTQSFLPPSISMFSMMGSMTSYYQLSSNSPGARFRVYLIDGHGRLQIPFPGAEYSTGFGSMDSSASEPLSALASFTLVAARFSSGFSITHTSASGQGGNDRNVK